MKPAVVLLAAAVTVGALACDEGSSTGRGDQATPQAAPTAPTRARRAPTAPPVPARPKVHFGPMGGARSQVEQAIVDLKAIGVWPELTGHLYRIDVRVRPGRASVPDDGHLADARFWKTEIARGTYDYPEGSYCWIRFFPAAMLDDLARWDSYFAQGLTAEPPPSPRRFWGAILAHELAHCPRRGEETAPEDVALAWERRVLDALTAAGVP